MFSLVIIMHKYINMARVNKKRQPRKKVVNSRKKVVDGIEFQSVLESTMYILLRDAGIKT